MLKLLASKHGKMLMLWRLSIRKANASGFLALKRLMLLASKDGTMIMLMAFKHGLILMLLPTTNDIILR